MAWVWTLDPKIIGSLGKHHLRMAGSRHHCHTGSNDISPEFSLWINLQSSIDSNHFLIKCVCTCVLNAFNFHHTLAKLTSKCNINHEIPFQGSGNTSHTSSIGDGTAGHHFSGCSGQFDRLFWRKCSLSQIKPRLLILQCDALFHAGLGKRVLLPTNPAYEPRIESWWAWNSRQHPWCLFQPLSASEVSTGLTALLGAGDGAGDWHIAVRSGGHSFGTSNNIDLGVTIDLGYMNQTTYDKKTNLASIGTGAKWWTVYAALQKHDVLVTGGRDGDVGVGGFTLGGGSSFFMNRQGFACDTVKNYEVVLANGTIANANKDKNADLWKALKGGGANFGIVTRFDLEALPNKELAYGFKYMSSNHTEQLVDVVVDFTSRSHEFPDDALVVFFSHNASMAPYVPTMAGIGGAAIYVNTDGKQNSPAFKSLAKIPHNGISKVANVQKKTNLTATAYGSQIEAGLWLVPGRQRTHDEADRILGKQAPASRSRTISALLATLKSCIGNSSRP